MIKLYKSSDSPHIRTREKISGIMWGVVIALMPALGYSVYHFGFGVLKTILVSVLVAVVTEAVILKMRGRDPSKIKDGSAVVTAILLAYNVPPTAPWWLTAVGSFVAIAIAKHAFGGLGYNIFNPALVGRAFLLSAWPVDMTTWTLHGVTGPTPLAVFKEQGVSELIAGFSSKSQMYLDLFFGDVGGCIGETSALMILIGASYMLYKKIITWHIPVSYIGLLFLLGWIFGGQNSTFSGDPLFYILSGGVFLGAFFMATDMVCSPLTKKGKLIFGFGCGLITFFIRKFGAYPEGVSYSILLMNACTPVIDRYIKNRKYGTQKRGKA